MQAATDAHAAAAAKTASAAPVRSDTAAAAPVARSAPTPGFDWPELWMKVLPPLAGIALLIGIWGILTFKGTTIPTPAATFVEAIKVFSDPFYSKGPNDQGIGWNILFSLERVAVVFGLAHSSASRWAS